MSDPEKGFSSFEVINDRRTMQERGEETLNAIKAEAEKRYVDDLRNIEDMLKSGRIDRIKADAFRKEVKERRDAALATADDEAVVRRRVEKIANEFAPTAPSAEPTPAPVPEAPTPTPAPEAEPKATNDLDGETSEQDNTDTTENTVEQDDAVTEKIAELEKENAELKNRFDELTAKLKELVEENEVTIDGISKGKTIKSAKFIPKANSTADVDSADSADTADIIAPIPDVASTGNANLDGAPIPDPNTVQQESKKNRAFKALIASIIGVMALSTFFGRGGNSSKNADEQSPKSATESVDNNHTEVDTGIDFGEQPDFNPYEFMNQYLGHEEAESISDKATYHGQFASEDGSTYNTNKSGKHSFGESLKSGVSEEEMKEDLTDRQNQTGQLAATYYYMQEKTTNPSFGVKGAKFNNPDDLLEAMEANPELHQRVYDFVKGIIANNPMIEDEVKGKFQNFFLDSEFETGDVDTSNVEVVGCTTYEDGTKVYRLSYEWVDENGVTHTDTFTFKEKCGGQPLDMIDFTSTVRQITPDPEPGNPTPTNKPTVTPTNAPTPTVKQKSPENEKRIVKQAEDQPGGISGHVTQTKTNDIGQKTAEPSRTQESRNPVETQSTPGNGTTVTNNEGQTTKYVEDTKRDTNTGVLTTAETPAAAETQQRANESERTNPLTDQEADDLIDQILNSQR